MDIYTIIQIMKLIKTLLSFVSSKDEKRKKNSKGVQQKQVLKKNPHNSSQFIIFDNNYLRKLQSVGTLQHFYNKQ